MSSTERKDTLYDHIKTWEEHRRHDLIQRGFVYPRTNTMRESPKGAKVFEYSCPDKCDFGPVLEEMKQCVELRRWQAESSCMEIVKDIDAHQADYLPAQLDGIYINRMGHELAYLKNKEEPKSNVTGFIEYNDLRREVTLQSEKELINAASGVRCVIC